MAFGLPAGISPNPTNGTPTVNVEGITGVANGSTFSAGKNNEYGSWNGDWFGYLNHMAEHGDAASLDKLLNFFMTDYFDQSSRTWTAEREDSQYQRLVADMKKAGINPYVLLQSGGSPISSAAPSHTFSGSNLATYEVQKEKNSQNWLKIAISGLLPIIGAVIASLI